MKKPASSLNLVDTNQLFKVTEWARAHALPGAPEKGPTLSYSELLRSVGEFRKSHGLRTPDASLAFVSMDPTNKSQQKFPEALERMGYAVERLDYRHNYVAPIGTGSGDVDRTERPSVASLGPQLAYVLGVMTGQATASGPKPEVVLVSGGFEVFGPLSHFVRRTGGVAVLAFFRRFVDARWITSGLLDPGGPIRFMDLDPHAEALLGVDLAKVSRTATSTDRGGIDSIF